MSMKINLNADMGEGYGAYDIGNDDAIMKIVGSVNVACGFHGGDAGVMRRVVLAAKENGVTVGAHPGFNDRWGFGRRKIDMDTDDLEYMVAYQIGALMGIASYAGVKVGHVKPHGALNNMAAVNKDYAMAIGRAIKTVDPTLIYLALAGSEMEKAGHELGLPTSPEAFIDRQYDDDGNLASRKIPDNVIKDPQLAADRVVKMVQEKTIISRTGKPMPTEFDSLCVHGDEPTAIAVAEACRAALEKAGVDIVTLPEAVGS
jgi:UPF0271 protein